MSVGGHGPHLAPAEVGRGVLVHEPHVVRGEVGVGRGEEALVPRVREDLLVEEGHEHLGEPDHRLRVSRDFLSLVRGERTGHAAGEGEHGVDGPAADDLQHALRPRPHRDDLAAELRVRLEHAQDVPVRLRGVRGEEEVRSAEEHEVQEVVGEDVAVVEELPLDPRRGRDRGPVRLVQGPRRCQVVGLRAHPADPLRDLGHLLSPPAAAERLEPPQLGNLEDGALEPALVIEVEKDLPVSLQPRDRVDDDLLHRSLLFPAPRT